MLLLLRKKWSFKIGLIEWNILANLLNMRTDKFYTKWTRKWNDLILRNAHHAREGKTEASLSLLWLFLLSPSFLHLLSILLIKLFTPCSIKKCNKADQVFYISIPTAQPIYHRKKKLCRNHSQLLSMWAKYRTNERANERPTNRPTERKHKRPNERPNNRPTDRASEQANECFPRRARPSTANLPRKRVKEATSSSSSQVVNCTKGYKGLHKGYKRMVTPEVAKKGTRFKKEISSSSGGKYARQGTLSRGGEVGAKEKKRKGGQSREEGEVGDRACAWAASSARALFQCAATYISALSLRGSAFNACSGRQRGVLSGLRQRVWVS